jgi:hypothetical protein
MGGFWNPIDFSGIVGYPHDISEDAIDNIPNFDHTHVGAHIVAFTKFINKWCDPPIYEDVLMQLFVFTLIGERESDWFHDSPDNTFKTIRELLHAFLDQFGRGQQELHDGLVDIFMETWKNKNLSYIETINSDIEVDPPSDPHGLELDSEKDKGIHEEILDKSIDESIIYFDEVKELEFENVEYLDDSSPHPPPEEPVFLNVDFENLEMVPMICSPSVFQPKDKLEQNYMEMEGSFSLSMSYHYEYWLAFHLDNHEQQSIQSLHGLSYPSVWLKGRRIMILGWFFLAKISKLIKLGKGSSVSHFGQGCFRKLWHHFIHFMDGCNVSLTFLVF